MERLATYGTLGPGRANHHEVAGIPGRWLRGTVLGHLVSDGWGAALGFPGIVLSDDGEPVTVDVLESSVLADHWARLDAFEGPGYRRVLTSVDSAEGRLEAFIYVLED